MWLVYLNKDLKHYSVYNQFHPPTSNMKYVDVGSVNGRGQMLLYCYDFTRYNKKLVVLNSVEDCNKFYDFPKPSLSVRIQYLKRSLKRPIISKLESLICFINRKF